jgi:hypothetical protein
VLSPNGGETWTASFVATVLWEAGVVSGPVDIDVSTDGGVTWQALAQGTGDDGRELIVVPPLVGTTVRVKVGPADGDPSAPSFPSDVSDGDFAIQEPFREVASGLAGGALGHLAWGDCDGDGDLDLATMGLSPSHPTRVYRNEGGSFAEHAVLPDSLSEGALAWADIDGDGDLDLAVTGFTNGPNRETRLYRNRGDFSFEQMDAGLTGFGHSALDWGDCDGDGDLDLAVTGSVGGLTPGIRVYVNDGMGRFTDLPLTGITGTSTGDIAWGDVDGDGDLDLALCGMGAAFQPETRIYRNDGGGTFTDLREDLEPVESSRLALADHDGDGDLDLALCGESWRAGRVTRLYANDGTGNFTRIAAELVGVRFGDVAWGDYDADGDADLAVAGSTGTGQSTARLYRNDGAGAFTEVATPLAGTANSVLAWADHDGDGDLDLVSMGDDVRLYENVGGTVNAPPTAPTGVIVYPGGPTTGVVWDAATDPESPAKGLSYNLRIGTSPQGGEIAPGHASESGQRRVPARGHLQPDPDYLFAAVNLPPGFYFLSLQAVDPGFRASAWSEPIPFSVR